MMSLSGQESGEPGVRSSFELKKSLMRRAFDQGRGPEMIQEILKRVNRARDASAETAEALAMARFDDSTGQSQAVRMLNVLAEREGSPTRFTDNSKGNGPDASP